MRLLALVLLLVFPLAAAAAPDAGVVSATPTVASTPAPAPVPAAPVPDGGVLPSAAPASAPASVILTPAVSGPPPSTPPSAKIDAEPVVTVDDAMAFYKAAKAAVQTPTVFGICTAISMFIFLVVGLLRRFTRVLRTRTRVRIVVAFAMAVAGGLATVVPGMTWGSALFVAISPLVAMAIHEFTKVDKRLGV